MSTHEITRRRMEVKRRKLVVQAKQYLTPGMLRIDFVSDELQGFESPSPDDHIKIFFPQTTDAGDATMRDFTPRRFDPEAGTITLDFAMHARGRAIDWARDCKEGDALQIGGPKGSAVVPDDFDWYLLVGDATALPSIGRRLEGLRTGVPVSTFITVDSAAERLEFETSAQCESRWIIEQDPGEDTLRTLREALRENQLPAGDGFIWIAAETSVVRHLYRFFTEELGHPKEWIKAAGYWTRGQADAGEKIS